MIPTFKSVQKTLHRNPKMSRQVNPNAKILRTINSGGGLEIVSRCAQSMTFLTEVNEKIVVWQSNRSRQSSLLNSLEVGFACQSHLKIILLTQLCTMKVTHL